MKKFMNRKGFTLIELLVVIAIIGILAALILISLRGAQDRARDTQRKTNARSLDTALAQHYLDNNTNYPGSAGTAAVGGIDLGTATACGAPVNTLVTTGAYLTSHTACGDPGTNDHRYFTNAATATNYTIIWELAYQGEGVTTSGNGIYQAAAGGVYTIPSGTPNVPAATTTFAGYGTNKAFSVYGPQ